MNEKATVAIIDDDDSIRGSLRRLLVASTGHEVDAFASAKEFLTVRNPQRFRAWSRICGCSAPIKRHRGRVMAKMKAESLAGLVLMAEKLGVRPSEADFAKAKGRIPTA